MVKIVYFNLEEKTTKRHKIKRDMLGLINFFQCEKFFSDSFMFFIWYINFKDCFKITNLKITDGVKKSILNFVNSTIIIKRKNFKIWTFSDRTCINKTLFSLNFFID